MHLKQVTTIFYINPIFVKKWDLNFCLSLDKNIFKIHFLRRLCFFSSKTVISQNKPDFFAKKGSKKSLSRDIGLKKIYISKKSIRSVMEIFKLSTSLSSMKSVYKKGISDYSRGERDLNHHL